MADFKYLSSKGNTLSLSGGVNYKLVNIDSQTSLGASLSSNVIGGIDGDIVNNVQSMPRTIVIDLRIVANVEQTKREILEIIKLKQQGTLVWKQNDRELEIKGIVESIDMPRWNNAIMMQITMHCEQPYWEAIDYIISRIDEIRDLHYFTDLQNDMLYFPQEGLPFGEYDLTRTKGFRNDGDVAVGLEIEIKALATVTNPIIYDTQGNFFGCGYGTGSKQVVMSAGDVIRINTRKNEKSITLNGTNILTKVKPQSTWLQLQTGDNQFAINSDDENITNMTFYLIYKQRYI